MNNATRSFQSLKNNAQGRFFEEQIERACNYYREKNIANIHKVPEPFRVLKKLPAGKFTGQFLRKAEPDFKGCFCFAEGLTERYFFVPFEIWLNMEKSFGKKSVTAEDLKSFEVYYKHSIGIDFLRNIKIKIEKGE